MDQKEFSQGLALTFITIGIFLCCTIFGAIFGIPMIYAGIKEYNNKGNWS